MKKIQVFCDSCEKDISTDLYYKIIPEIDLASENIEINCEFKKYKYYLCEECIKSLIKNFKSLK